MKILFAGIIARHPFGGVTWCSLMYLLGLRALGHEVFYIASPDNAGGHDFAATLREHYGDRIELREPARPDSSGISCAKAVRLLGWAPKRSWRDYLDENGHTLRK